MSEKKTAPKTPQPSTLPTVPQPSTLPTSPLATDAKNVLIRTTNQLLSNVDELNQEQTASLNYGSYTDVTTKRTALRTINNLTEYKERSDELLQTFADLTKRLLEETGHLRLKLRALEIVMIEALRDIKKDVIPNPKIE